MDEFGLSLLFSSVMMTAWEVAGEYVYTTPGDQDSHYLKLTLNVDGYRWSQTYVLNTFVYVFTQSAKVWFNRILCCVY